MAFQKMYHTVPVAELDRTVHTAGVPVTPPIPSSLHVSVSSESDVPRFLGGPEARPTMGPASVSSAGALLLAGPPSIEPFALPLFGTA